jgi:hypothetical protein
MRLFHLFLLFGIVCVLGVLARPVHAAWNDTGGWDMAGQIKITNNGDSIGNMTMLLVFNGTFNYTNTTNNMADFRITTEDNLTNLTYWRDFINTTGGTASQSFSYIYFQDLRTFTQGATNTYYYWINNSAATTIESSALFFFYDACNSTTGWTATNGAITTSSLNMTTPRGSSTGCLFNDTSAGGGYTGIVKSVTIPDVKHYALDYWFMTPSVGPSPNEAGFLGPQYSGVGFGQTWPIMGIFTRCGSGCGGLSQEDIGNGTALVFSRTWTQTEWGLFRGIDNYTNNVLYTEINVSQSARSNVVDWNQLTAGSNPASAPNQVRFESQSNAGTGGEYFDEIKMYNATYPFPTVSIGAPYAIVRVTSHSYSFNSTDTLTTSDTQSRNGTFPRQGTEAPALKDTNLRTFTGSRNQSDIEAFVDSVLRGLTATRFSSDVMNAADAVSRLFSRSLSAADVLSFSSSNASWCYQESPNTTNQIGNDGGCVLNYSGVFSQSSGTSDSVYSYINYSKPTGALNASLWQVKHGDTNNNQAVNLTIDSTCWNYNNTFLVFRIGHSYHMTNPEFAFSSSECYNGTAWIILRQLNSTLDVSSFTSNFNNLNDGNWSSGAATFGNLGWSAQFNVSSNGTYYEEAMWWKISSTTTSIDLASRQLLAVRNATDTFSVVDSTGRQLTAQRVTGDTFVLVDSSGKQYLAWLLATDTLSYIDSVGRTLTAVRSSTDTFTVVDSLGRQFTAFRTGTDIYTFVDASGRQLSALRTGTDTYTLVDGAGRQYSATRTSNDQFIFTDAAGRKLIATRSASDVQLFLDSLGRTFLGVRNSADTYAFYDTSGRQYSGIQTAADTFTFVDASGRLLNATRQASDVQSFSANPAFCSAASPDLENGTQSFTAA